MGWDFGSVYLFWNFFDRILEFLCQGPEAYGTAGSMFSYMQFVIKRSDGTDTDVKESCLCVYTC